MIDSITVDRIARAVNTLVSGKPTLVVSGNSINSVPSVSDVKLLLK